MTKILGMGNALVDILIQVNDDNLLHKHHLPKGSMQLVDFDTAQAVLDNAAQMEKSIASGGSAANTINGLARLGLQTGFIGVVGHDEMGEVFENDLKKNGVEPQLIKSENRSGLAVALVTADAERTFATYLGAAIELSAAQLKRSMFEGYDYFHIEGYLVQNHELIEQAITLAGEAGCKVSLDLASFNVVEENLDFLKRMASQVDIVFANEEEARAFTGMEPEEALHAIAEKADIAVVKIGSKGSLIKHKGQQYSAGVIEARPIDTTGAGDLFAAGFLYGLSRNLPLDRCAQIGSIVAGNVIEVIGAKMDNERWSRIINRINN